MNTQTQETLLEKIEQLGNANEYDKQAKTFLSETGTTIETKLVKYDKHFSDDKKSRLCYAVTISRGERKYSFNFGESIAESQKFLLLNQNLKHSYEKRDLLKENGERLARYLSKTTAKTSLKLIKNAHAPFSDVVATIPQPSAYTILACLQKSDVGSLDNFASEFGYNDNGSKISEVIKTYNAVVKEFESLKMLFSDAEIEALQQIN